MDPAPNAPPSRPQDPDDPAGSRRWILDVSVGAALGLALLLVALFDALSGPDTRTGELAIQSTAEEPDRRRTEPAPLRLAVTPPEFDDMGGLLDTLGDGYQYEIAPFDEFLRPGALKQHDVVFLTCGGVPTSWLGERLRDSQRGSAGVYRARQETVDSLYKNIRDFVREGGTLYVSDFHFDVLVIAFPEFIDEHVAGRGDVQTVKARVVDEGLRKQLGSEISLRFDKPAWRPAAFRRLKVATYLEGEYRLQSGGAGSGPLLASFAFGEGAVIFTSFHNEAQNSELEKLLLRYLVFATVTARDEENVRRVLVKGGFSPRQRNLLALAAEEEPAHDCYRHERTGPLQFVLGFANRGAQLKLTVTGPAGERVEKSSCETFSISVERATAGRWEYTVTPTKIPYRNFPFTLTIGEKAEQQATRTPD